MFDTMTFTKIMGGLCGSLLVFLLGKWAAEEIYHMGGGHGDGHDAAYVIDTGEGEEEAGEEEEEVVTLASLYPAADTGAGERVFGKCKACHQAEDGVNGVGPHLYGVVGRDIGSVDAYGSYSGALSEAADVWTPENLYAFLENPSGWAPGTSMGYAGLKKPEDRANLIAYLDMTDGDMTEVAAEEGASEDMSSDEGTEGESTEEATADASGEEQSTEEAAAEDGSEEEATEDAATEEGSEEQAVEEAAAEEGSEEEATEQAAAEDSADEAASEEQAAEESAGGEGSAFAQLVAAADVADGEKAFRKCAACHKAEEEANGVGPHLVGVVGRDIGGVDGFNYSDALAGLGGQWTVDELNAWLEDPKSYAPGNKMAYRGVRKEEERAALIAYLESTGN